MNDGGTIRQRMIGLLKERPMDVREISQELGISEKDVYVHLEHIRRSVSGKGIKFSMELYKCLSCGYVFKDRSRIQKPGRCPKCRLSRIQNVRFHIPSRGF